MKLTTHFDFVSCVKILSILYITFLFYRFNCQQLCVLFWGNDSKTHFQFIC